MALDYKSSLGRYRKYLQMVQTRPLWSASMWVIMSLILLIILSWMALRPTLVTISGLFGQIRQQKELSERLDKKILTVRNAIQEMDDVEEELPLLYEMIPTSAEWNRFADEVYQAATNSGMMIQSIAIDEIPNKVTEVETSKQTSEVIPSGIIPIKFTISGKGEYEQFTKMLSELEKNKRLPMFTMATIDIDKNGQLNLNLSGEIGYMPAEKAL